MDKTANMAVIVGRRSFIPGKLVENVRAAIDAILKAKPTAIAGEFIKNMTLSATMTPGIKLEQAAYGAAQREIR
jgi:large subunit ribosomal protein L1